MRYQSTTGLDTEQLTELVARVHDVCRSRGTDRHYSKLGLFRQVVLVLVLLRQNISQMLAGDMFGVSQPTVSRIRARLAPILAEVLAFSGVPLAEAVRGGSLVLVDGTYIPTGNRPASGQGKANYSGKHHVQCLSVQVVCDPDGGLLAVSQPVPGARHDSAAIDLCGWEEILDHNDAHWAADTAYIATSAITPIKKPKHRKRLEWEKEFNRAIASLRAPVEHSIAHLKNWKTLSTGYRGRLAELPDAIHLITKLELYRLDW